MRAETEGISQDLSEGFSIFYSVWFLLNFLLLFNCIDPLTLERHSSFQNKNDRKATHIFAPRPLKIFGLQQEV